MTAAILGMTWSHTPALMKGNDAYARAAMCAHRALLEDHHMGKDIMT